MKKKSIFGVLTLFFLFAYALFMYSVMFFDMGLVFVPCVGMCGFSGCFFFRRYQEEKLKEN
jgi:hypothetical protein